MNTSEDQYVNVLKFDNYLALFAKIYTEEKSMYCNKCGSYIPSKRTVCSNCGTPVPDPSAPAPAPVVETLPEKRPNGIAVAGLVMGILTLVFCWVPGLPVLTGLLGLIFSIAGIAKKNSRAKGAAVTGLILSIAGTILSIFVMGAILVPQVNKYMAKAEEAKSYLQTMETVETD